MKLPQLSLRELFLLVVIAAMGCGWWVSDRQSQVRHEAEREEQEHWSTFLVETLDQNGVVVKRMPAGFLAQPKEMGILVSGPDGPGPLPSPP